MVPLTGLKPVSYALEERDIFSYATAAYWYPTWDLNPEPIDFESIASANWTSWAFGTREEIRTLNICVLSAAPLPVGLHEHIVVL